MVLPFLNRWKDELSVRKSENISSLRAASCTTADIDKYFDNCEKTFIEAEIDMHMSKHVWNVDETGFSADQGRLSILVKRGTKRPLLLQGNNEKACYTVQNCCNADGFFLPPMIVYKAKNRLYDSWMKDGPPGTVYTSSPSGWMESDQFVQWLVKLFIPNVKQIGGKNILLLDGHLSHVSLKVIELCRENNISLICLPAHSSHILQPLDVGVYGHVKKVWRSVLQEYYFETRCKNLGKEEFPGLLKKVFNSQKAFTRAPAVTAFEKSGFFPLNKNNIDKSKLKIAETFDVSEAQEAQELEVIVPTQSMLPTTTKNERRSVNSTPTQQPSTVAVSASNFNVTPDNVAIYLNYAKTSLETALKMHLQLQNVNNKKKE